MKYGRVGFKKEKTEEPSSVFAFLEGESSKRIELIASKIVATLFSSVLTWPCISHLYQLLIKGKSLLLSVHCPNEIICLIN